MSLPGVVAHADWSVRPGKRWMACERLNEEDCAYRVSAPEPVGDTSTLLQSLTGRANSSGQVLIGFDFPIGVPFAYAKNAGVESFRGLVSALGSGMWADFYRVAERPDEISLRRPFYPQRPGGTRKRHLVSALEVSEADELLRFSDRRTATRRAACCLFWTLGGNQVGKAALAGWREVLVPHFEIPIYGLAFGLSMGSSMAFSRPAKSSSPRRTRPSSTATSGSS